MKVFKAFVAALAACATCYAGGNDFDRIVKAIEAHYGVSRTHVPLMGVANLFVKVKHVEGVSGFKLALFQDLQGSAGDSDFMDNLADGGLHRIVRVRSRRDGEATYVFAEDAGKSTRLLVATFASSEVTVVEVKADASALIRLLSDPEHMGNALAGDREDSR